MRQSWLSLIENATTTSPFPPIILLASSLSQREPSYNKLVVWGRSSIVEWCNQKVSDTAAPDSDSVIGVALMILGPIGPAQNLVKRPYPSIPNTDLFLMIARLQSTMRDWTICGQSWAPSSRSPPMDRWGKTISRIHPMSRIDLSPISW